MGEKVECQYCGAEVPRTRTCENCGKLLAVSHIMSGSDVTLSDTSYYDGDGW